MKPGIAHQGLLFVIACILWQAVIGQEPADKSAELSVKPIRCVSLNQGQVCYQKVKLQWSQRQQRNVCLTSSLSQEPLQCWRGQNGGEFQTEIASTENVHFHLVDEVEGTTLASTMVQIAWVYKHSRGKITSWRLF